MSDRTSTETKAALEAVRELLEGHFAEAEESADEEGVFSLAFRLRFCRSSVPTRIKVTCRVSKVIADAIECSVDDPDQGKLPP